MKHNEKCGHQRTTSTGSLFATSLKEAIPLRYLTLIVPAACLLAGCATDVVMQNPRTGDMATCRASVRGLNPWSQQDACIADHIAQGWRRASTE